MAKQTFTPGQILTAAQVTALQNNEFNQTVSAKTASYTLVAADVGTTITMSAATATIITVNTSLFAAGDTLTLTNIGAGTCTITAGTATVSSSGALNLRQNQSGTLYFTSTGVSIFFPTPQTETQNARTASYTLVAGDVGKHVTMSSAAFPTITVNTSLFVLGDQIRITNIGSTSCKITAGTCTVTPQGNEFLTLSQNTSGILYFTSASTAIWLANNPGKTYLQDSYGASPQFSNTAISMGNGTTTSYYTVDGAYIDVEILLEFGTTSSSVGATGTFYIQTPSGYNPPVCSPFANIGTASFLRSGVGRGYGFAIVDKDKGSNYVCFTNTGVYGSTALYSVTSPFTLLAVSNAVYIQLRYRWSQNT